jgi:hypothetical protein
VNIYLIVWSMYQYNNYGWMNDEWMMNEWRWDKASFLINIRVVLERDVKDLTLFHITVHMQVLNANIKSVFCEAISWR